MANWATFVVVSDDGGHEVYESRFGAVGLDIDLLAGPGAVLPFWWLLDAQPEAYEMGRRWLGWTVEWRRDRWDEHVRAANGLFVPPPVRMLRARAEIREEARRHWSRTPIRPVAHGAH